LFDSLLCDFILLQEQREAARKALDDFLNLTGHFRKVILPDGNASKAEVTAWWRSKQPSHCLREMGLWCSALGSSQGQTERYWATPSRQVVPIRASLHAETKQLITSVACNWRLLYPDVSAGCD